MKLEIGKHYRSLRSNRRIKITGVNDLGLFTSQGDDFYFPNGQLVVENKAGEPTGSSDCPWNLDVVHDGKYRFQRPVFYPANHSCEFCAAGCTWQYALMFTHAEPRETDWKDVCEDCAATRGYE